MLKITITMEEKMNSTKRKDEYTTHMDCLKNLCRICGKTLRHQNSYLVKHFLSEILEVYEKSFVNDSTVIHPHKICHSCYCKLLNARKGHQINKQIVKWYPHALNCKTCSLYDNKAIDGRPKKVKLRGRPQSNSSMTVNDILSLKPDEPLPKNVKDCVSHVIKSIVKTSTSPNHAIQLETGGPQVNKIVTFNLLLEYVTYLN